MSVIFGIRAPVDAVVTEQELLHLAEATNRYALEDTFVVASGRIGMGYQPYDTHVRSRLECQPVRDAHGNMVVFDGRLDNHEDLCREFLDEVAGADSLIVLRTFLELGAGCFSRFVGDWAIALWSAQDHVLYLATDHAGTRTLYFEDKGGTLVWSTYLETFLAGGVPRDLDEDYAALYLATQPVRRLTPYKGVSAVGPAHYVVAQDGKISCTPHWQWMSRQELRYRSDAEYEEHFLTLFERSVERRTGLGASILAQLSGGMDSTSIVCMSDHIRRLKSQTADLLDTVSFYDDSEPNWNERPYFSSIEAKRGKVGTHIETSFGGRTFEPPDPSRAVYYLPGRDSSAIEDERYFQNALGQQGIKVILSGLGGDEVLGGVPTFAPELADYLVSGQFIRLIKRTTEWGMATRKSLLHVLVTTIRELYRGSQLDKSVIPPWITPRLRSACFALREKELTGGQRFGLRPSAISNGLAWWSVMETLPHRCPEFLWRYEYRYPYLDRDLVDFLSSIPREQLVRPGHRRSLMRRALRNIVPADILERRRKSYVMRGPLISIRNAREKLEQLFMTSLSAEWGLVDPPKLLLALNLIAGGKDIQHSQHLVRAIALELWLRANTNIVRPGHAGRRAPLCPHATRE